jgi:hypothetical protein
MTKSQYDLIRKSDWLISDTYDFMHINNSMKNHMVFEHIIINVAAAYNIDYRSMLHSEESNPMYVPKCICYILIDRIFNQVFNYKKEERISLLGYANYKIIEQYNRYKAF